jgi:predicted Zn-dependent protease
MGANAVAFPGGPVVITDALVALAPSDAALAGVMAHELAHVRERHGLRQAARAGSVLLMVALVFGDAGSMIDQLAAAFGLVVANAYSRDFEREADQIAAGILRGLGIPTEDLARLLERLGMGEAEGLGWLGTHPEGAERARELRTGR